MLLFCVLFTSLHISSSAGGHIFIHQLMHVKFLRACLYAYTHAFVYERRELDSSGSRSVSAVWLRHRLPVYELDRHADSSYCIRTGIICTHFPFHTALPTTQSHLALQPTPTPTTSYSPSNGSSSRSQAPEIELLMLYVCPFAIFIGFEPYLLFANPNSINQVRLTGRNLKLVTSGLGNADALDFDIRLAKT